jgi:hypothetical protein
MSFSRVTVAWYRAAFLPIVPRFVMLTAARMQSNASFLTHVGGQETSADQHQRNQDRDAKAIRLTGSEHRTGGVLRGSTDFRHEPFASFVAMAFA